MITDQCSFDFSQLQQRFKKVIEQNNVAGFKYFKKLLKTYLLFHVLFLTYLALLGTCLYLIASPYQRLHLVSIFIALFSLSTFTYLALIFYFQAKKVEQIEYLVSWYVSISKKALGGEFSYMEHYLSLAGGLYHFAHVLNIKNMPLYKWKLPIPSLDLLLKKMIIRIYRADFFFLKEKLMQACIHQHLLLLKHEPTSSEVHGSLGNSYLSLAKLYKSERDAAASQKVSIQMLSEESKAKCTKALCQAIEEYRILEEELSQDPWVLMQLAICFHELEDFEKEIFYFEKLLENSSQDDAIMYRLAELYFTQNKHAKGFKLYKILRDKGLESADQLIENYIETASV